MSGAVSRADVRPADGGPVRVMIVDDALVVDDMLSHWIASHVGVASVDSEIATDAIRLRARSVVRPQVVAIGSSTGGPQALSEVVSGLAPHLDVPILIAQHMPATFTAILAETLSRHSGLKCLEAAEGMMLEAGHVYVAPGDFHMLVRGRGGPIALTQTPPENYCRPAVDPMFRSLAAAYGAATLAVVLTGMGSDGREGARAIAAANGTVLVQDQASSVVWGMPAAVAHAGFASAVLPLTSIAAEVRRIMELAR